MQLFLGVAWPYASGPRHLGHLAGAYVPADIVARASRLAGDEVLLVSGSDQFGTPITVGAEREGITPAEFAERHHRTITATFDRVGISFDHYTKTATPTHERVVHDVFRRLQRAGLIQEAEQPAAWCPQHRRSLPDRYVEGTCPRCTADSARGDQCDQCGSTFEPAELIRPRCRECGTAAELRPLRQLVLQLDRVQSAVEAWLAASRPRWRRWVAEEAAGALRGGLLGRAITRDLPWGVPVPLPGWSDRRLYVWFDAVIGYLSATVEWAEQCGEPDGWRRWWENDEAVHRYFVGKDNVWFHAIWWPAILLGAGGLHLPDDVVAAQFLTESGDQLSTSRGHGTTIDDAIDVWGVDGVRHAVCALSPENADAEISVEAVTNLTRTGLLGDIANPAHRLATLWWQRRGAEPLAGDAAARTEAQSALDAAAAAFRSGALRAGLAAVHAIGRTINQRLATDEPWKLGDAELVSSLATLSPWAEALSVAAWPVAPDTASRIRSVFGWTSTPETWLLCQRPTAIAAAPVPPLS